MKIKRANLIFTIVISIACIVLAFLPTGFENPLLQNNTIRVKAKVIKTYNDDLQNHTVIRTGTQELDMVILRGKYKGDTVNGKNVLMGQMKLDKIFTPGDRVLAVIKTDKSGEKIIIARADDMYRIDIEWILFGIFALFLISFAGFTGFKALLSFTFTALAIWKILIPFFLKGYNPLLLSFTIVVMVTAVIILLVSGFTKKGGVALAGSAAGIAITTILALVFGHFFHIPGTVQEFSDAILYMGYTDVNLSEIFISCIFISAAGAVMDVAMDIAASQNEIAEKKPDINAKELIKSGFSVAYPVIGTMTTTLLFAYSGSFMFVFMTFMAKGTPLITVFNTNYIAAEILHTLVGSFGLVLVAPTTAIIGGYVLTKHPNNK